MFNNHAERIHFIEMSYNEVENQIYIKYRIADFPSIKDMIAFFAKYGDIYLSDINATGKDFELVSHKEYVRDENGAVKRDINNECVTRDITYKRCKSYYLYTDKYASIDPRKYIKAIKKLSLEYKNGQVDLRYVDAFLCRRKPKHGRRRGSSHTCSNYRRIRKHNTIKQEYDLVYEDERVYYKYYANPKKKALVGVCWDDSWMRKSTGWKDHKHKHQWEHRIFRKK